MNGQIMEIKFNDQSTYPLNQDAFSQVYRVNLSPYDLSFTPNYTLKDFTQFMNLVTKGETQFPSALLPIFSVFLLNMGLDDILINVTTSLREMDYSFSESNRYDDLLLMDFMVLKAFGSKVEQHFKFLKLALEYSLITCSMNHFMDKNGKFSPILANFTNQISFVSVKSSLYLTDRINYFSNLLKDPDIKAPDRDLVISNTPKFFFQLIEMYIYKGNLKDAKIDQDSDQNPQVHSEMQVIFPFLKTLFDEGLDQDSFFTIADTFVGVLPNKPLQTKYFNLNQSLVRQQNSLQTQKIALQTVITIRNKVNSKQF